MKRLVAVILASGLAPSAWGQGTAATLAASKSNVTTPPLSQWHHTVWSSEGAPYLASSSRMLRSSDGYLWLGTGRTLTRFDGVRFTTFDSSNTPALRHPDAATLSPMFLDSTGALWIRGDRRATFTYLNGQITRRSSVDSTVRIRTNSFVAKSFIQDGAGRQWWADRELVNIENGRITRAKLPAGVPDTGILEIVPDTGRGIWLGTATQGMWHVTPAGYTHYPFAGGRILPCLQSSDGTLWAYSSEGRTRLWRLVGREWKVVPVPGGDSTSSTLLVMKVVEAPDHAVWIATRGRGVLRWQDETIEQLDQSRGLSNDNVHALWIGLDGVVWLVTDVGLERLRSTEFATLDTKVGLPFQLGGHFAPDNRGGMWVQPLASATLYHLQGGVVAGVPGNVCARAHVPTQYSLFKFLGPSRDGGVWIAPYEGGLMHVGAAGHTVLPASVGLPTKRTTAGVEMPDGTLWMKSGSEFGRIRNGRYRLVPLFGLEQPRPSTLLADDRGRVWVPRQGTNEVAIVTDDSTVHYLADPKRTDGFHDIALEGGDTVWLHASGALFRAIDRQLREVKVHGADQFLVATSHLAAGAGSLWLYNRFGLIRFPLAALHRAADNGRDTVRASVVNALDGIQVPQSQASIDLPMLRFPDGRMWFATPVGFSVTSGPLASSSRVPPVAHIEEISVEGIRLDITPDLRIPPTPDRVAIRYTATNLTLPERVHIEYRLEGADREWVDGSGNSRVATYTQLRPGTYHFHVRAWNEYGVADTTFATMEFRVLRAWYQSFSFYTLGVLLLTALGYVIALAVSRDRNRQAAQRTEARFKAVLDERVRIARELHDTLLQGFTGITLHLESVRRQLAERSDPSAGPLSDILQSADGTLREAREMVWDIRSPELDRGLIFAIESDSRRVINGHRIELRVGSTGSERRIAPSLETTIMRIAREAVVNALKHAEARSISIRLGYELRRITLTVSDDGRGAQPAQIASARSSGHWGIAGMRERATSAGGTLEIRTAPDRGMTIEVSLPTDERIG